MAMDELTLLAVIEIIDNRIKSHKEDASKASSWGSTGSARAAVLRGYIGELTRLRGRLNGMVSTLKQKRDTVEETIIWGFQGLDEFLCNFFLHRMTYNGVEYATSEHAYQAAKATKDVDHEYVRSAETPGEAKQRGQTIARREDWDDVKVGIMKDILRAKFSDGDLIEDMLETGDAVLIEGNTWHDNFWGDCGCDKCTMIQGKNNLGKVLMEIREEIKKAEDA